MAVDDRIRSGLTANARVRVPPVEQHLDTVLARRRRHTRIRVLAVAAAMVAIAVIPWILASALRQGGPPPAATVGAGLPGTYRVDVVKGAGAAGVAGTWRVTLGEDGAIDVVPPVGHRGPVGEGETYEWSDTEVTTNLFVGMPGCQRTDPPVGVYLYEATDDGVAFTRLNDSCPARARLFATPWERLR